MNRIYKYRPLSDFLFKELYYQEIYFASYNELNDPLDLSSRIEFTSKDKKALKYLIRFIFKTQFDPKELQNSNKSIDKLLKFSKDEKAKEKLVNEIYNFVNITLNGYSGSN